MSSLVRGGDGFLTVGGLSLLITALAGLQLVLFLSAFGLSPNTGEVLLVLVLTLAAGNLPFNLPGSGTVSAAVALLLAGIHGPGVAGFVLLSRVAPSGEVMLLACCTLAWWDVTGRVRDLRVGATFQSLYQASWRGLVRHAQWVERGLTSIASAPSHRSRSAEVTAPTHRICGEPARDESGARSGIQPVVETRQRA